jgi:hypothetical protein
MTKGLPPPLWGAPCARRVWFIKCSPELALYAIGGLKDGVFHVGCG